MLKITGYSDRIHCRPGDKIRFMVSCETAADYDAEIVRIVCGDDNPKGPGLKEHIVESAVNGRYKGRKQAIASGSYGEIPTSRALNDIASFTLHAFIWPTTPMKGTQGIITRWSAKDEAGFALVIDDAGSVAVKIGDGEGRTDVVAVGRPMQARRWYRVGASFDAASRRLRVFQQPIAPVPGIDDAGLAERQSERSPGQTDAPLLFAALAGRNVDGRAGPTGHYNGKIDSPCIFNRALDDAECGALGTRFDASLAVNLVGAWDFSQGMASQIVVDQSPNRLNGRVVNFPARAMTGWNWTGEVMDWKQAPSQWGAIHFHDDDLYDAGWEPDFELTIPASMKSGLYAARLRVHGGEEYIPFTVGPASGKESRLALLLPTASYMAYGNDHLGTDGGNAELLNNIVTVLTPPDLFLNEHWEYGGSLYDAHSDGSGICYSSRLRPLLHMRPKVQCALGGFGHSRLWQFNADTHLIDWLEEMGHSYDVITDEELHERGYELLAPYAVVMSGTHPEYCSTEMWNALDAYRNRGGRFMYLGGDGWYWRIAYHAEYPGIIELRRAETGVRAWSANAGEYYQNFDGRYGGLWLRQGRSPQSLFGVGFAAQGFDLSTYYTRLPDSFKPAVRFIFEGIGEDERIGDFGLIGGGAAGLEVDRAAFELGTPPNAYIVARSEGHTNAYYLVPEEFLETGPALGGDENPAVRADIVFFQTRSDGAVFSVGSIAWGGCLSHNNYDNNVSRITNNVLQRFLDPRSFGA
jgi:N,N-dimethylformamidase